MPTNIYLCFCDFSSSIFSLISLFKRVLLNINIADMPKFWTVQGEFSHQNQQSADVHVM